MAGEELLDRMAAALKKQLSMTMEASLAQVHTADMEAADALSAYDAHRQKAGGGFDGWWEDQIRRNGDCDMGADYRHWAHAGWNAALSAAEAER